MNTIYNQSEANRLLTTLYETTKPEHVKSVRWDLAEAVADQLQAARDEIEQLRKELAVQTALIAAYDALKKCEWMPIRSAPKSISFDMAYNRSVYLMSYCEDDKRYHGMPMSVKELPEGALWRYRPQPPEAEIT